VQVLQKNPNTSYVGLVKDIIAKEGFRGLYAGLPACYLKFVPLVAITLSVNERLKDYWNIPRV